MNAKIVIGLLIAAILATGGALYAQDDEPEYRFLLHIWDDALFRVDCSGGQCVTVAIPLPLTEECPFFQGLAPTPDGERILLTQRCLDSTTGDPRVFLIDLAGNILAEYERPSEWAQYEVMRVMTWSPDEAFVILSCPGKFTVTFYDPVDGFTDSFDTDGLFGGFSPDGTRMLFTIQPFEMGSDYQPALADMADILARHTLQGTLLLSDEQTAQMHYAARGWFSDHEIRLEVWFDDADPRYIFDLETGEMTVYDAAKNPLPSPYHGGFEVRRNGDVFEIWDTNTNTLFDEMTFALPDRYAGLNLAACFCRYDWLNPPEG